MSPRDLLYNTANTLWTHKLRTALTMFGIAWGIVSITLMLAAGEGLAVGFMEKQKTFGKDIMIIFGGRTSMQAGGIRAGRSLRWRDTDHLAIKAQSPACREVIPELGRRINVRSRYNSGAPTVVGSLPVFAQIRSIAVAEGRFYNEEDVGQARRVAFLGSDVKKQLFATRAAVGEMIRIGGIRYTVIGVMVSKDQNNAYDGWDISKVFIPFTAMQRDFPERPPATPHTVDRLIATPRRVEQHEECKAQIRGTLARIYRFNPLDKEAVPIWDTVENAKAFRVMTDGMKYFLGAVGLVTLMLGGIGVMNIMLVAVRERTREIGIRKAVGASARTIRRQFFVETTIVVLASGGVGLGFAFGLCALVNLLPMPEFFGGLLPTIESSLLAFGLLGTVAFLSALYPASRAAGINPMEALRSEAGG